MISSCLCISLSLSLSWNSKILLLGRIKLKQALFCSTLAYTYLCHYEDRMRFDIAKSEMKFPFVSALTFCYICRISEAVRHSQAENVIFACLCALLSLYLQQIRRQTTVISNHPTLCTTCRLSYILPCKTQGKRLNPEIPCSVCTKTVKTNWRWNR